MFSQSDIQQITEKGLSEEKVLQQLQSFKEGFPFLPLISSASVEKGIKFVSPDEQEIFIEAWDRYLGENKDIVKFVPASGAASRMFKDLFEFLKADYSKPTTSFEQTFFEQIEQFAFFYALNDSCLRNEAKSIKDLIQSGEYKAIVENLLQEKGLNYGQLPKGLIEFHFYQEGPRTAMEEHLVEGALYAKNDSNKVNIHFTVSSEHKTLFEKLTKEKTPTFADHYEADYLISFSEQKKSTDTIAADAENLPFRENNQLVFRPGGHGALIENLNDLEADIVFVKNIDNVVPDHFKHATIRYKRLLAGILVSFQKRIFKYLNLIDSGQYSHEQLMEMLYFLQNELCIKNPNTKHLEDVELVLYIKSKLNRPIRVCGMVRNLGEPGGGPFLAVNPDGTISPQILESSQIDLEDSKMKELFEQGTHFNPVDLVCGLRDYKGESFDLLNYIDHNTGFISIKSKSGKELKALELPGLWNGAMSDWSTVFVEVPIETFNPAKTVNDLLRPEHQ
ncbi:DUF4301 family protein [Bacteroidales bacterium OttesenSCG-928-M11]|nr:DUF4301 family protein [Bacteroidales bacterium OttesenSCG-928-M11]